MDAQTQSVNSENREILEIQTLRSLALSELIPRDSEQYSG